MIRWIPMNKALAMDGEFKKLFWVQNYILFFSHSKKELYPLAPITNMD